MTLRSDIDTSGGPFSGSQIALEVNEALDSIATDFMGATDPATLPLVVIKAGMRWADTSTGNTTSGWVCQRNAANTGWTKLYQFGIDQMGLAPARQFRVHAQATPNMTVAIDGGNLQNGTTRTTVAAQNTATLTAPTTNPRNDLVVIDQTTGAQSVVTGTEAASPADPTVPSGKTVLARVRLTVGMSSIPDASIDDLRPLFEQPSLADLTAAALATMQSYLTPINNSGAASDLALGIGQSAYVDFTSATSIPLHIATGDNQLYEIEFESAVVGAANVLALSPNNTTYAGALSLLGGDVSSAGSAGGGSATSGAFQMTWAGTPYSVTATVSTKTTLKRMTGLSRDYNGTTGYILMFEMAWNDTTTAWTSLGSLTCTSPITGRVYIRRLA